MNLKNLRFSPAPSRLITLYIECGVTLGSRWTFTLPTGFAIRAQNDFIIFADSPDKKRICASAALYPGGAWIHASVSREDKMPTYEDLCDLKAIVFGPDRFACQVFVPESEHVNIHPNCLHLWGPMQPGNWPLPDFTMGTGSI